VKEKLTEVGLTHDLEVQKKEAEWRELKNKEIEVKV